MREWAASDRSPSEPLMTPTTALAAVKPADAPIDDSATFCLTSGITRLRAATGNDQGCGRQCSGNDVRCRRPQQVAASWKCERFACDGGDRHEAHDLGFYCSRAKGWSYHERREVASALPPGRMC